MTNRYLKVCKKRKSYKYDNNILLSMKCPHCKYEWIPRVEKPKACPRCKQYLQKREKGGKIIG